MQPAMPVNQPQNIGKSERLPDAPCNIKPLRPHKQVKAQELLNCLNAHKAHAPRVQIEGPYGPIQILYEPSQAPVTINILKEALRVFFNQKDCRKITAPSVADALLFMIDLEKVRQGSSAPLLAFSAPEPKDPNRVYFIGNTAPP